MKNAFKDSKKINKNFVYVFLLALILLLIIGTSYALWNLTFRQEKTNVINTDCFKVDFSDKNPITLKDAYPLTDVDGGKLTPYEFTITNICSEHARYEVNLEILDQTTLMNHSYIKAMYNEDTPKLLTEYESVDPTLDNAVDSYNLEVGYLENGKSKTFNLRLWLDEDTPLSEDTMNKTLSSKVTVTTNYAKKLPGTLRTISSSNATGMWEYKSNITKLVIQNRLNKINGAIRASDESLEQDESIMSYVVPNEDGETYTAYLQGQDVIYLNPDSSQLFSGFGKLESIKGMRNFDTSNVTNMKQMFYLCNELTSINLENFNTSKVTSFYNMFSGCSNLTNLDLSSFDTSQVTDMQSMFNECSSLASLDVSNFNTSKVTYMNGMFMGCSNLITLNLSNFNTSQVTSMGSIFNRCRSLTSLDLSSFDTSNVTTMWNMFSECNSLTNLNVSSFNTGNVTDMGQMFSDCSSLTGLDLNNFDTSNVINMKNMFSNCTNLKNITYGSNYIHKEDATISSMFIHCPANKPTGPSWDGVTF